MPKPIGLGRGLASLIPGPDESSAQQGTPVVNGMLEVSVNDIRANPMQPRLTRGVDAMHLKELCDSIKEHGVLEPLIVTRTSGLGAPYTLIAGERRWRAAQMAGLTTVPVPLKRGEKASWTHGTEANPQS